MVTKQAKVLFLATANAARGQMAEAFVRHYAGDQYDAYSAGLAPMEIHPLTRQVMDEVGIDISGQQSVNVAEYLGKTHFGYIITVCSSAEAACPRTFLGVSHRLYWDMDDPTKFEGSPEETLVKFREVRDEVDARVKAWLADPNAGSTLMDWEKTAAAGS
ncbi:MAG: arsenate reductase ArsC [Chloroflexota bacterium]